MDILNTVAGASGVYPGCTDLAYQQAVDDGADIIDCSVQMSKDGVAFCLNSADLMGDTTAMTAFISRSATVPEIQQKSGIFSFDLTWSEIQGLKPEMISPVAQADLKRNPAYKNQGKFFTLSDFLDFAKGKAVPGILINIQNAAYLASNKGLDITDAVISALSKAGYDKETTQQVLIQSDDTSVLSAFQKFSNYKRVLMVPEVIGDAAKPAVEEIKHFANAVSLSRGSIVITENSFITGFTDVVNKMHAANISVYVSTLINEYVAIAFDDFSDPMVAISTYTNAFTVDGIMTEFPATATKFMSKDSPPALSSFTNASSWSPCFHPADDAPYSILPAQAGSVVFLVPPELLPPSEPLLQH
ncbi:glycerophosphodiester phosphodiesterase GDPDL7 [Cinnamomum micranthum f. kanehirae]|uniref:glycerophosphodiester phosphodiesterase n=1 Tax=Cinnamomum micranthum f. kanehirae TaxID=337451 RepID=A0A443PK26_9MAGN|nr:glycerophosphodiester phosphodiesterase GDPDL7 [Cinnamomum micranthum f. kanehirae]